MYKKKEHLNHSRGRYKGTVNVKIVRYSNTDKSELFCYDEEKDIIKKLLMFSGIAR